MDIEKLQNNSTKTSKQVKLQSCFKAYQSTQHSRQNYEPNFQDFVEYTRLRSDCFQKKNSNKINLQVCTLENVLGFAVQTQLIPYDVFLNYQCRINTDSEKQFIALLKKNNLKKFNFEHITFCPVDHRMLSYYLSKKFPSRFIFPNYVHQSNSQLTKFYVFLYQLTQNQYFRMYDQLRHRFNRHWMPKGSKVSKISNDQCDFDELFAFNKVRKLRKN